MHNKQLNPTRATSLLCVVVTTHGLLRKAGLAERYAIKGNHI